MIKIYFDWNVLSQIKNGNRSELKEIIFDNEKLFIPFSTAHIRDIFSRFEETNIQQEFIESDLDFKLRSSTATSRAESLARI
jgi:hypothetical protein